MEIIKNDLWKVSYVLYKNQTFFKAKEIARLLGYVNPCKAIQKHVEVYEKKQIPILGTGSNKHPKVICINESGIYSLILSSKLPQAREFRKWITTEVLPSIRKTGGYSYEPKKYIRVNHQLFIKNETDLHSNVISYIKELNEKKYNIVYSVGLGEMQDTEAKRIDAFKKGYLSGTPDLIIMNKTRKYDGFLIELKTPKGNGKIS